MRYHIGPSSPGQSCLPRRAAGICQGIIGPIPFRQASDFSGYLTAATSISSTSPVSQYKYGGKEWNPTSLSYDFGARNYLPAVPRWNSMDPLAEKYYSISPYVYCAGNPVNRVDFQGEWDITVHVFNNRTEYGYGVAVVTDRSGNEIYRFTVRAQGIAGENRLKDDADTPLGVYNIPSNSAWISGGNRASYGPNARLNMSGMSGEIIESGRSLIRIHGGRQEEFSDGKWQPVINPTLEKTQGCLRAYDSDISFVKTLTGELSASNPDEVPGNVTIVDDLERIIVPVSASNKVEISVQYSIPEDISNIYEMIRKKYGL